MMIQSNHFNEQGEAIMADISEKENTVRVAIATGRISMNEDAFNAIVGGTAKKGDVLGVARIAGIMAVKQTPSLIPLCHPLMTEKASIDFELDHDSRSVIASCMVRTSGKTGVEMEALCGINIALLTIYDMCKALDKGMEMSDIHLVEKQGGKSGHYRWEEKTDER